MKDRKTPKSSLEKGARYLKERGAKEFMAHTAEKLNDKRFDYRKWIRKRRISSVQAGYQKKLRLPRMPKVWVLVSRNMETGTAAVPYADRVNSPGLEVPSGQAGRETLRSVLNATYPKVYPAGALNSQIGDEDYLTFVREGDLIERNAFFEMVCAVQDGADAVYTDEDSYTLEDGRVTYCDPLFKPDYNPDYLRSVNYVGRLLMVRAGLIRSLYQNGSSGRIPSQESLSDDAFYYSLVLRCLERASAEGGVRHVPKVLCHVRKEAFPAQYDSQDQDTSLSCQEKSADPACGEDCSARMKEVLEKDLIERGRRGRVEDGPLPGTWHVAYEIPGEPLVSIVIQNRDNASVLENCIGSILSRSSWKHLEIIVVENNSRQKETLALYRRLGESGQAKIIRYPHPFHFSRIVNEGVRRAAGEYIILMNNDVTVRTPDWIERLLAHVCRPEVGCAGPKLLYPDGRVQSAGIVTGIMGYAGSMMVAEDGDDPGYMGRAVLTQDMSAVTAACMMVRREAFLKAGAFPDEFSVALGDVDFCLSLGDAGYRVVFEPSAVMIHHESLTRGAEDTKAKKKRFASEKAAFRKKRSGILKAGDPAYNPNLSRRRCDWSQQT